MTAFYPSLGLNHKPLGHQAEVLTNELATCLKNWMISTIINLGEVVKCPVITCGYKSNGLKPLH